MPAQTEWPLIWTVSPKKYNFEGTLGKDKLEFEVQAIPDPNFPEEWNKQHSKGDSSNSNSKGGQNSTPIPPLPPKPILEKYIIHGDEQDKQVLSSEYYDLTTENGLVISDVSISIFFPFQYIKYNKNGQLKSAQIPQDVIDDNFSFIVEFVPDDTESIEKKITIEAVSNSSTELKGTFWFLLNNDWTEASKVLKDLAKISKENIENKDSPEGGDIESTKDNQSENIPFDPGSVKEEQYVSFEEKTGMTYDELFRKNNPNKINTVIEEIGKEQFLENIKKESKNNLNNELENPLRNEGSTVDEILKNNTVQTLVKKYNLTPNEVLNYLRNI
ncbi:hypothetical protein PBI_SCTP2_236 [Salicola phage SCTP-2]|nr:hypothetical protein PBI_SCTP2_236 [Salicola phage SCTP-2]